MGQRFGIVKSVTPIGRADVYNLEVEGTHCFAVNGGLVVHNCIDAIRYAAEQVRIFEGGMVYSAPETDIVVKSRAIPDHWPKVYALDIDGAKASVLWAAFDKENDTLYAYGEYVTSRTELALIADAIRKRGLWIPGLFDHLARKRTKPEGIRITDALVDLKLDIFTVQGDPEAGISELSRRFTGKRFKVFDTCTEWLAQYRAYRRNKDGDLVEESDGLMRAMDLLALSGPQVAMVDVAVAEEVKAEWGDQTRDSVTGY